MPIDVLNMLGLVLAEAGNPIECYRRALSINPAFAAARGIEFVLGASPEMSRLSATLGGASRARCRGAAVCDRCESKPQWLRVAGELEVSAADALAVLQGGYSPFPVDRTDR
jgi:hypothetical protein